MAKKQANINNSKTNKTNNLKKAVLLSLEVELGNVTNTCKAVGISRYTFYEWCKKDEEFKRAVDEINEVILDFAESELKKQIKDGNTTATIFLLKCKGKRRGYVENDNSINNTEQTELIKAIKQVIGTDG